VWQTTEPNNQLPFRWSCYAPLQGEIFKRELVDDSRPLELLAAGRPIKNKIPAPNIFNSFSTP
jgi:hypothetical protein